MDKTGFLDCFGLGVEAYREAYRRLPNAVVVPDRTMQFLYGEGLLRDKGNERGAYSGTVIRTSSADFKVYWRKCLTERELGELEPEEKRRKDLEDRGNIPLTLATQILFHNYRGRRFENPIYCDLGVSREHVEVQIRRQIRDER